MLPRPAQFDGGKLSLTNISKLHAQKHVAEPSISSLTAQVRSVLDRYTIHYVKSRCYSWSQHRHRPLLSQLLHKEELWGRALPQSPMALVVSADQLLFLDGGPSLPVSFHRPFWSKVASIPQSSPITSPMSRPSAKPKQIAKPAFVFIDEAAKSSKEKRKQIRSQAKRYAIAERSKRPREIRFVNVPSGQDTQALSESELKDEDDSAKSSPSTAVVPLRKPIIIPDLPAKGYDAARIEYGFDVFFLSGLASVHVGKGASLQLHDHKLGDWLSGFREKSYLDCIPSHYNTSPLLQSVVNCTMAQYKRAMCPTSQISESTVFKLYGKALQDLQTALNDNTRRMQPDVLLATAVLQLFEVCHRLGHCAPASSR